MKNVGRIRIIPNSLSSPPDLQTSDLFHLLLEFLSVIRSTIVLQTARGFSAILHGVIQVVEDGLQGVLEPLGPVDSTTTGRCRASCIHIIHTVCTDQRVEGLCGFLDRLIEGFRRRVATLSEDLVLSKEHAVNATHEAATLAVEVRIDLLLECGLVEIAAPDCYTQSDSLLFSFASHILVDSNGGIDAASLAEQTSDCSTGTLRCDEDDINVRGHFDLCEILEDGREAVGEIESLTLCQHQCIVHTYS